MNRPFHEVGSLFSGETNVTSVPSGTSVIDALHMMVERRYSQLPVVDNGAVRGVFSLWSLAQELATAPSVKLHTLAVEDVMETIPSVTVTDSLHSTLGQLRQHEALLVSSPKGLQAIVTAFDVLHYFYTVARPFILLQEIELALRVLIAECCPGELLQQCIQTALGRSYEEQRRRLPSELHDMSFDDYRAIITTKANWTLFEGVLGRNRDLVSSKLDRTREIRNAVFHFRSTLSVLEYQTLVSTREWLLDKTRQSDKEQ